MGWVRQIACAKGIRYTYGIMVGILKENTPRGDAALYGVALCSSLYISKICESQPVSNGLGVNDMLVSSNTNFGRP